MSLKLNLGAGGTNLPGYVNVDRKNGGEVYPLFVRQSDIPKELELRGLLCEDGTPVANPADNSVDEIYASHVLEHFPHHQTLNVLKEWVRALKPGGTLKVAVPNFDYIVHAYANGEPTPHPVESYLMGGHTDDDDRHGAIFNEQKLRDLMRLAGLSGIRAWRSELNDCASLPVSLNLMGVKAALPDKLEGVTAVLSMPRLGFTDTTTCLLETSLKLKIPTLVRQGVFWGQTLTAAIEQALAGGAKYVLTVDYDTIFNADDVRELYRLMERTPDAAAVCGMQIGRDRDAILMTMRGDSGANADRVERAAIEAELLPIATGHFGLTLIRAETFAALPKPWFWHKPDSDGGWGDGRVDEDIYFWRQLEAAGLTLYQANHVRIGHVQTVVSWPDRNLAPLHQLISDYRKQGKPQEVA